MGIDSGPFQDITAIEGGEWEFIYDVSLTLLNANACPRQGPGRTDGGFYYAATTPEPDEYYLMDPSLSGPTLIGQAPIIKDRLGNDRQGQVEPIGLGVVDPSNNYLYAGIFCLSGGSNAVWGLARWNGTSLTLFDRFPYTNLGEERFFRPLIWNPKEDRMEGWFTPGDEGFLGLDDHAFIDWAYYNGGDSFTTIHTGAPARTSPTGSRIDALTWNAQWNEVTETVWVFAAYDNFSSGKVDVWEITASGYVQRESQLTGFQSRPGAWAGDTVTQEYRGMGTSRSTTIYTPGGAPSVILQDDEIPLPDPLTDPQGHNNRFGSIDGRYQDVFYGLGFAVGGGGVRTEFWKFIP